MSYDRPRIKFEMSMMDVFVAMSEGNPGALRALMDLAQNAAKIDPDSALGALGPLCQLDNLDCYGSRIWMLYKDVCGHSVHKMVGVLRCNQMGLATDSAINRAIDGDRASLDIPAILAKLKERLPHFAIEPEPEVAETLIAAQ